MLLWVDTGVRVDTVLLCGGVYRPHYSGNDVYRRMNVRATTCPGSRFHARGGIAMLQVKTRGFNPCLHEFLWLYEFMLRMQ